MSVFQEVLAIATPTRVERAVYVFLILYALFAMREGKQRLRALFKLLVKQWRQGQYSKLVLTACSAVVAIGPASYLTSEALQRGVLLLAGAPQA